MKSTPQAGQAAANSRSFWLQVAEGMQRLRAKVKGSSKVAKKRPRVVCLGYICKPGTTSFPSSKSSASDSEARGRKLPSVGLVGSSSAQLPVMRKASSMRGNCRCNEGGRLCVAT